MERAVQTFGLYTASEDKEDPRAHNGLRIRRLIPQETSKPKKQQKEWAPQAIEFSINGKEGIRLSDALEENWRGFDGRDDTSLFGEDRFQITVRLHASLLTLIHISHYN